MKYRVELFKKLLAKYPNIPLTRVTEYEEYTLFSFGSKLLDPSVTIYPNDIQQVELTFYQFDKDNNYCPDANMMNMVDAIALLNLYFYD